VNDLRRLPPTKCRPVQECGFVRAADTHRRWPAKHALVERERVESLSASCWHRRALQGRGSGDWGSGVVDQEVDASVALDGLPHRVGLVIGVVGLTGHAQGVAGPAERGDRLVERLLPTAGDDDPGAVRDQSSAIDRPMPRLTPVMIAVFPSNLRLTCASLVSDQALAALTVSEPLPMSHFPMLST